MIQSANYKGITLDCVYREGKELELYAQQILNSKEAPKWKTDIFSFILEWFDNDETVKAYTSGSTGAPKQIMLRKDAMIASALKTNHFFKLKSDSEALLCLSAAYIAGKMMIVRAIVGGFNLLVQEPSSEPLKYLRKKIDFIAMVPMQVKESLKDFNSDYYINTSVIIGGGVLSDEIKAKLFNLPARFYETYGMTETVSHVAVKSINEVYFQAMQGVSFEKDDRDCLIIIAPDILEERLVTNDIVLLKDNKNFKWEGRYDNVINSGGVKIMAEKVEAKLRALFNIPLYISSIKDAVYGERLILVLENGNKGVVNLSCINSDAEMTKYEIPKEIRYVAVFPTVNNKIDRKQLKAML